MMDRRRFVMALGASVASAGAAQAFAQDSVQTQSSASNMVMNQDATRSVSRPPKPGARPQLDDERRDALEHRIKCQCGCPLDIYTCRTTDFTCSVSPAMHRDVRALVAGGYSADEIIDAFVDTYGEQVLMAPKREGFNWTGYLAPFAALGAGAVVLSTLIRRWGARAAVTAAANPVQVEPVVASPDELARIAAAVRNEED